MLQRVDKHIVARMELSFQIKMRRRCYSRTVSANGDAQAVKTILLPDSLAGTKWAMTVS